MGRVKITIPYKPRYPEVHKLLDSRRFVVLVAHRRFGKTVLAVNHLIKAALTCGQPRGHFAYVAPHRNQAKNVAWGYLKHFTARIPNLKINESELSISLPAAGGQSTIRIFGADNPDALRGLYFDAVVLDEVAQMKPEVWEEIIQPALADRQGSALFIGTPKGINLFSRQYHYALDEAARGSTVWGVGRYTINDTNALPAEEVDRLRRELSDAKYRQEMLCDFTASSDDILITLDQVAQALKTTPDQKIASQWPLILGVDIARFGEDATVFFPRRGLMALPPLIFRKKSNTDIAQRLISWISENKPRAVNIDQGQGTGVIDIVRDLVNSRSTAVNEIPFGSKAIQDDKFVNRRAEMWHAIRQWLKSGGALPDNDRDVSLALQAELSAPSYSFDAAGRLKLEAKEDVKKRLKHSTDIGDALALTFAVHLPPESIPIPRKRKKGIYDPFK